jgi:diacylglycerol O-acyltransferase / wax synthase
LGITVNDVVLAIAAGGLRKLLLDWDGKADRPIIASVPTATDKSDRITGNEISGLMISLPCTSPTPSSGRGWSHWRPGSPKRTTKSSARACMAE